MRQPPKSVSRRHCSGMNPFRILHAALFDLDGTLIETRIDFPLMKREVLALAARFGVDSEGLVLLDILTVIEEARRRLIENGRAEAGERLRAEAFSQLEEIEAEQCRSPSEMEGAAELLRQLRSRGIRVGIVTRNCRRVSLDLARYARLEYDSLVTRDDVPLTKPDPGHLIAALVQLGLDPRHLNTPPPERRHAVMVGDHWMDVQAGKAAGISTIGILHGRAESFFEPAMPDLLVDKPHDLLSLLP